MKSYTEVMAEIDRAQRPPREELSCKTQPKVEMKVVTTCERIQPTVVGQTETGEPIWEGRAMARWQMEMLRLTPKWFSEFFTRWIEVKNLESKDEQFKAQEGGLATIKAASKERLNEMRRMYPLTERPYAYKRIGD